MKTHLGGILAATTILAATAAYAQPGNGYGNHMWGGGMFGFPVGSLLWLGLIVLVVVVVWRALGRRGTPGNGSVDAIELLKERYARGEIDDAEYDRMRRKLADDENG